MKFSRNIIHRSQSSANTLASCHQVVLIPTHPHHQGHRRSISVASELQPLTSFKIQNKEHLTKNAGFSVKTQLYDLANQLHGFSYCFVTIIRPIPRIKQGNNIGH